jgi:hypothetical protein
LEITIEYRDARRHEQVTPEHYGPTAAGNVVVRGCCSGVIDNAAQNRAGPHGQQSSQLRRPVTYRRRAPAPRLLGQALTQVGEDRQDGPETVSTTTRSTVSAAGQGNIQAAEQL